MKHNFYDFDVYHSPSAIIPQELLQGGNKEKLLIIVKAADFTDEEQSFASKVFSAVDYQLSEDAFVLLLPDDASYAVHDMVKKDKLKHVIIFGIDPRTLGYSFQPVLYKPFRLQETQFLIAHKLKQISESTSHKKALWSALKSIFEIV